MCSHELQFIASLTLSDHMGDVMEDIAIVLDRIGMKIDVDWDAPTLRAELAKRGITTLFGSTLSEPDDD